jgi:two-component sensor histidine kinase
MVQRRIIYSPLRKVRLFIVENENNESGFRIQDSDGYYTQYDFSLNIVRKTKAPLKEWSNIKLDIDQDKEKERIFFQPGPGIAITRMNLKNKVTVGLQKETPFFEDIYLKKNKIKPNEISVQLGNTFSLISYGANPWFPFRFPALFGLWGLLSGIVYLIQFLQQLALKEKYLTERRVSELQLLLVRNQISPHFLFNAINSISYRLMEKDPEEANNSIIRLSRLIRNNLVSAERFSRTLQEELEASVAYMEIVRSQSEEPFEFNVTINNSVNKEMEVPVMVIQNYLENAVKHGVKSMGFSGIISVEITSHGGFLHIQIRDNGIGRQKAAEQGKNNSTGKGVGLMEQFYTEINKYNQNKISSRIIDLYDELGAPAGTAVQIDIPEQITYRIYEN